jgi:hypothetical protein
MITRSLFNGIDKELFGILELFFETLSPRMPYNKHNDLFHEMEKRLTGHYDLDATINCEFERYGEKVIIQLSNYSLVIKFISNNVVLEEDSIFQQPEYDGLEMEMYSYSYVNTEGVPEIIEEGDFEYFSDKLDEIYCGIDIDKIILSKQT